MRAHQGVEETLRHIWLRKGGFATCQRCTIKVKEYRIKRGGITPCHEIVKDHKKLDENSGEDLNTIVTCGNCGHKIPDTIICLYCAVQRHPLGWMKTG